MNKLFMFSSISCRYLSVNSAKFSKIISQRVIIPPRSHFKQASLNASTPRHEYKQLPEDSNFIENFYSELEQFEKEYLRAVLKKTYYSFENDPDELIFQLEKYVELHIVPKHSLTTPSNYFIPQVKIYCNGLSDKVIVERYLEFINAVRMTLRLNGGHSFIFDILLKAKNIFDQLEKGNLKRRSPY